MKTIGLFFGGMSNEAGISVLSARNIIENFDYRKYRLILVHWHKDGNFFQVKKIEHIKNLGRKLAPEDFLNIFDVALPITHGKYGEDGVLQGIFESQKVKYCGCKVLSSALCMDKAVFKGSLVGHKIRQARFISFDLHATQRGGIDKRLKQIRNKFSLPVYVKPSNSGSSIGITRVEKYSDLERAIRIASRHDSKILIEEGIQNPREIEVAIIGNDNLIISEPGELILAKDFYSYDDKYKFGQARSVIPASIAKSIAEEIKKIAGKVYKLCDCRGFARIDFFLSGNKIYLNEVNTLPGFTNISMFPLLMQNVGMSYTQLINRIIELALTE